jgi:magnesium transporter
MTTEPADAPPSTKSLAHDLLTLDRRAAVARLADATDEDTALALQGVPPSLARELLALLTPARRQRVIACASDEARRQWSHPEGCRPGSVARLMQVPIGVFGPDDTVGDTVEELRELVKKAFITYGFVTDPDGRLLGVFTMRDLLFADRTRRLSEVMLREPFSLAADTPTLEAMRQVLGRHYPVYPVCDADGRLVGLVRGQSMFEAQAYELSAQAGRMVGVEKEERLATPWLQSLKFRHPWLQLNLLTAFVAAAVVGAFQGTIERIVILSVFLPVLAGQSGNTGCQALAVALRGITLGELEPGKERALVMKEGLLGLLNGVLVGLSAGAGMYVLARAQDNPNALVLGAIVWIAMTLSCIVSGLAGALIPLALKRAGADPATASSIFLTTATDVASMGFFLGLAALLIR